jgi:hypothetical protein
MNTTDRTSFFKNQAAHSSEEENQERKLASQIIKNWWKKNHLKKTAMELVHYVHEVISLQQADSISLATLEAFIINDNTQKATHNLLKHIEQAKAQLLPTIILKPLTQQRERQFLAAYIITTKSQYVFESATEVDLNLLAQATELLKSFEQLCKSIEDEPLHQKLINDLEMLHQSQEAYYETYARWEPYNRDKLVRIFIMCYLELETKRFIISTKLDPRQLELYEGFGNQQKTLKKKIEHLLGEEGLNMLESELSKRQNMLEANRWITASTEWLSHEVALNPELKLQAHQCAIHPQKNIDEAINALSHQPTNIRPILNVIEEIWNQIALFTPNNKRRVAGLQRDFNKHAIKKHMDEHGVQKGLYEAFRSLIEEIQELESSDHNEETNTFLDELDSREDLTMAIKVSLDFIYTRLSQINMDLSSFYIQQKFSLNLKNIVSFEQLKFQERLEKNQFNLAYVLGRIDKIVSSPEEHHLSLPTLCSQHIGHHMAHAIILSVVQQSEESVLHTAPETFYLDRMHLVDWHQQYQSILYTALCMGHFELHAKKYNVRLSPVALQHHKNELLCALNSGEINSATHRADHLVSMIEDLHIRLSPLDKRTFRTLIEDIDVSTNPVTKLFNKRLGNQLFAFLQRPQLDTSKNKANLYGLYEDLYQLSQKIAPRLHLHVKVHADFYQKHVRERLWSPLFSTLRTTPFPSKLPTLLALEKDSILQAHASLHKMVFVLSGLVLIQQAVWHEDIWSSKIISNVTLKERAYSSGLIAMIYHPDASKEMIQERLIKLMDELSGTQTIDRAQMVRMVYAAKNKQTQGCKAFQNELVSLLKQTTIQGKNLLINPNNLIAEFKTEVSNIAEDIKRIIDKMKRHHAGDDVDPGIQSLPVFRSGGR